MTMTNKILNPDVIESNVNMLESVMQVCELWANNRSKDPNTKVGAAVYDTNNGSMHLGYNGFPRGILDTPDRWQRPKKYEYVRHAEENAIVKALASGSNMKDCVLLCTHKPCGRCAGMIINVGIKNVHWRNDHDNSPLTDELFTEARVVCGRLR